MQRNLYLTFDDGPSKEYTPKLLDLLKKYEIKASFFVVVAFAHDNPQIIKRMQQEGHYIGLHSLNHKSAYLMLPSETKRDLMESKRILKELGTEVSGYRPPWGHLTPWGRKYAKENNLNVILWDVMTQDWQRNISSNEIGKRLKERSSSGDIICLHDGRGRNHAPARMIEALEWMIPQWIEMGYSFRRVDERDEEGR